MYNRWIGKGSSGFVEGPPLFYARTHLVMGRASCELIRSHRNKKQRYCSACKSTEAIRHSALHQERYELMRPALDSFDDAQALRARENHSDGSIPALISCGLMPHPSSSHGFSQGPGRCSAGTRGATARQSQPRTRISSRCSSSRASRRYGSSCTGTRSRRGTSF